MIARLLATRAPGWLVAAWLFREQRQLDYTTGAFIYTRHRIYGVDASLGMSSREAARCVRILVREDVPDS